MQLRKRISILHYIRWKSGGQVSSTLCLGRMALTRECSGIYRTCWLVALTAIAPVTLSNTWGRQLIREICVSFGQHRSAIGSSRALYSFKDHC